MTIFVEENLAAVVTGLFIAGTDTTSSALMLAFRLLVMYPHYQEQILQEIRSIAGKCKQVSVID